MPEMHHVHRKHDAAKGAAFAAFVLALAGVAFASTAAAFVGVCFVVAALLLHPSVDEVVRALRADEKRPVARAPWSEPSREEILAARRRGAGPNAPPWIIEGISETAWKAVPENAQRLASPTSAATAPASPEGSGR